MLWLFQWIYRTFYYQPPKNPDCIISITIPFSPQCIIVPLTIPTNSVCVILEYLTPTRNNKMYSPLYNPLLF